MDGRALGALSLRVDAIYCAVVAGCVLVFAAPLAQALVVPAPLVLGAAVATAVWALGLHRASRAPALRPWLLGVLAANTVAAGLAAALAVTRPRDALSLLLLAVAVEVAAFAVSQAVALRRGATS